MARRRLPAPFAAREAQIPAETAAQGFVRPPVARVAAESAAEAALRELSVEMRALRDQGRVVVELPLDGVRESHLLRDRLASDPEDFAALITSIRNHGQRTPIEVSELEPGRYGLISGWRRLHALRALQSEDPDRFATVLALVRSPDTVAEAYVAMVEENEIRVGLSYWERARVAVRTTAAGVFVDERDALRRLFASASRARRSKIGSFTLLVHALDGALMFPSALSERTGLALAQAFEADPLMADRLRAWLEADPPQSAEAEQERLQTAIKEAQEKPNKAREGSDAERQSFGDGLWLERRRDRLVVGGRDLSPALIAQIETLLRSETKPAG